jgi:hypothetical protein
VAVAGAGALAGAAALAGRRRARSVLVSDANRWLDAAAALPHPVVSEADVARLPEPVATWLRRSGAVGRARIRTLRMVQRGHLRTAPDGPRIPFIAEQESVTDPPTLLWLATASVAGLPMLLAYDTLIAGHGEMHVSLAGVIPVGRSRGAEVDEGTLHRYLAEIASVPSAALDERISWRSIDERSAEATMTLDGSSVTAIFTFGEDGLPIRVDAHRYRSVKNGFVRTPWTALLGDYRSVDGVSIPHHVEAIWHLPEGDLGAIELDVESAALDSPHRAM